MAGIQNAINSVLGTAAVATAGVKKFASDKAAATDALKADLADTKVQSENVQLEAMKIYEKYDQMTPEMKKANESLLIEIQRKIAQRDLLFKHADEVRARLGKKAYDGRD